MAEAFSGFSSEHILIRGDPMRRAVVTRDTNPDEEEESTQHVVSVFLYISETVITECHTYEWKVLEKKTSTTHLLLLPLLLLISPGGTNATTDNTDCFSCLFVFFIPVRL